LQWFYNDRASDVAGRSQRSHALTKHFELL